MLEEITGLDWRIIERLTRVGMDLGLEMAAGALDCIYLETPDGQIFQVNRIEDATLKGLIEYERQSGRNVEFRSMNRASGFIQYRINGRKIVS